MKNQNLIWLLKSKMGTHQHQHPYAWIKKVWISVHWPCQTALAQLKPKQLTLFKVLFSGHTWTYHVTLTKFLTGFIMIVSLWSNNICISGGISPHLGGSLLIYFFWLAYFLEVFLKWTHCKITQLRITEYKMACQQQQNV